MRVECGKANALTVKLLGSYRAVDGILGIEETIECGFCDVVGDGTLVEGVVLAPEILPCLFVGGLDGAYLVG